MFYNLGTWAYADLEIWKYHRIRVTDFCMNCISPKLIKYLNKHKFIFETNFMC